MSNKSSKNAKNQRKKLANNKYDSLVKKVREKVGG